jgi:mono/diheme cytochrome c family protein
MSEYARYVATAGIVAVLASVPAAMGRGSQAQPTPPLILKSTTGQDSFEFYCASCHGKTGKGDGPLADVLKTPPADLTVLARRNDGAFPKDRVMEIVAGIGPGIAAHGPGEMPVWGPIFRALDPSDLRVHQRIENIVEYIETLQEPSAGASDPGARLFKTYCATCHGQNAHGDGPLAEHLRQGAAGPHRVHEQERRSVSGRACLSHHRRPRRARARRPRNARLGRRL